MSSTEVFILVTIIATTIHYCTMWGSYLEKKMILDDHIDMASKRKKVTATIIILVIVKIISKHDY